MVAIQIFWEGKAHNTSLLDALAAPLLGRSFLSCLCSLKKHGEFFIAKWKLVEQLHLLRFKVFTALT